MSTYDLVIIGSGTAAQAAGSRVSLRRDLRTARLRSKENADQWR